MHRFARLGAAVTSAALISLTTAAAAEAGRIDYVVPPSPTGAYVVDAKGDGNGIVKVTYLSCATAGTPAVLPLNLTPRGPIKGTPTADWKVLKVGAADLSFDPAQVRFDGGTERTRITITPTAASAGGARLRIKLHGENGSGLGEGPGIMVSYVCVLAPAPAGTPAPGAICPPAPSALRAKPEDTPKGAKDPNPNANPNAGTNGDAGGNAPAPGTAPGNGDGNQGNGNGNGGPAPTPDSGAGTGTPAPGTSDDPLCAPAPITPEASGVAGAGASKADLGTLTAGAFPATGSSLARRTATCIASPRSARAVAGEQLALRVRVAVGATRLRGVRVRVTTPDGTVTKTTDGFGVASFRVRPSKTGRVTIQADACFGSRTVRVRGARLVSRQSAPQFAG